MNAPAVYVLDDPPTEQDGPVYHTSAQCPMVKGFPPDYMRVPLWIVEQAGIRHCERNEPASNDRRSDTR